MSVEIASHGPGPRPDERAFIDALVEATAETAYRVALQHGATEDQAEANAENASAAVWAAWKHGPGLEEGGIGLS